MVYSNDEFEVGEIYEWEKEGRRLIWVFTNMAHDFDFPCMVGFTLHDNDRGKRTSPHIVKWARDTDRKEHKKLSMMQVSKLLEELNNE